MFLEEFLQGIVGIPAFSYYIKRDYNPQSGSEKRRVIWKPNEAMRQVHERFSYYLKKELGGFFSPYAMSNRLKVSTVDNALLHRDNRFFYLLDLESAYPNLDVERTAKLLCSLEPRFEAQKDEVIDFLSRYFFLCSPLVAACEEQGVRLGNSRLMQTQLDGLPTGGPAAPFIFDLVAGQLIDRPLEALLIECIGKEGWVYSRYTDDITLSFSTHHIEKNRYLRARIREVMANAGFETSHHKAKLIDIERMPVPITGLNLVRHESGKTYAKLSKSYLEYVRHILFLANKRRSYIEPQTVNGAWGPFYASLKGRPVPLSHLEKEIVALYGQFRAKLKSRRKSKDLQLKMHLREVRRNKS